VTSRAPGGLAAFVENMVTDPMRQIVLWSSAFIRISLAGRLFAGKLAFAPGALIDDLVAPVVGHLFPFACLKLGPQTADAQARPAIEAALLDTW
jgi:hypothetical protein